MARRVECVEVLVTATRPIDHRPVKSFLFDTFDKLEQLWHLLTKMRPTAPASWTAYAIVDTYIVMVL